MPFLALLRIGCAIGLAFVTLLFVATYSRADDMHAGHPPQDMELHNRFYSTWMMPDNRAVSCCHERDCYPTEARNVGGVWFAKRREDGEWLRIPDAKVETERDNPDGRNHLCAPTPAMAYTTGVFCFIPGGGT